jgi:CheY-like chemotaxis protein
MTATAIAKALVLTRPDKLIALADEATRVTRRMEAARDQTALRRTQRRQHLHAQDTLELFGGFEVLAAEDSERGCELAVTEHPDVILMDLEMPVVDRWEPVRRLKNDLHIRDIPIIGMSAHALESERGQAIATGCDEFDAKPIKFDSLVATIRRVLAHPK